MNHTQATIDNYVYLTEKIASEYRKQRRLPVIGVTGSVGKTTTKELIAQILSTKYCVHKSIGSCNGNDSAVRDTLGIKKEHQICVFELGIDDSEQMHRMVQCCRPTIPILTGIKDAHLEKLKSLDAIYCEKSHIFDTLPPNGKIIANGDDKLLMSYLTADDRIPNGNIFTYGLGENCMIRAEKIVSKGLDGSQFVISGTDFIREPFEVKIQLPGLHMVQNAVCAILMGILFDVSKEQIVDALHKVQYMKQRCHVIQNHKITIIDDSYNASPSSVKAALELLREADGRRVCILGDMNELGDTTITSHEQIGEMAISIADEAIFIGSLAKNMCHKVDMQATSKSISWYSDKSSFFDNFCKHIREGDTILVKASHQQHFSEIVKTIEGRLI